VHLSKREGKIVASEENYLQGKKRQLVSQIGRKNCEKEPDAI